LPLGIFVYLAVSVIIKVIPITKIMINTSLNNAGLANRYQVHAMQVSFLQTGLS